VTLGGINGNRVWRQTPSLVARSTFSAPITMTAMPTGAATKPIGVNAAKIVTEHIRAPKTMRAMPTILVRRRASMQTR
jgi:hypothetical protein